MSRGLSKNQNTRASEKLDDDPLKWTRRVKCPSCGASIPILEADPDGIVRCFCETEIGTTASARAQVRQASALGHLDEARAKIEAARKKAAG